MNEAILAKLKRLLPRAEPYSARARAKETLFFLIHSADSRYKLDGFEKLPQQKKH
jgi:hypothetical protein